ncbi:CehA/McbA family metallohydrolase [Labilithrix luteola]|uniref:CehA/McbA family metallohydrolase n=1 Tax=Labilithrix luteola TaxID=1391654 RepID=UPI00196A17D5|nr:CehA/McbA family metallohydrolase [Labilithrix luteola]
MAIVAALIAFALAFGAQRGRRVVPVVARAGEVTELGGKLARFAFFPASGRIVASTSDGHGQLDLEMSLVVDGVERPIAMRRSDVQLRDKSTLAVSFPVEIGEEHATGLLELKLDPSSDLLSAGLAITPDSGSATHTYALRVGLAPESRSVFVPGVGTLSDLGTVDASSVVIDDDAHAFALVSTQGAMTIASQAPDLDQAGARPRLVVTARTETAPARLAGAVPKTARLDFGILVGASSQAIWGRLYKLLRSETAKVTGIVTGTHERAHVFARGDDGHPMIRAMVDGQGRFVIEAPKTATQWYAALETAATSAPIRFPPGTPWELKLDVSAGGELSVRVIDGDTGQPLVSRLLVKGIEGTIDPSFGPDYRASGAGPLMDMLDGEVTTPLPAGRYRVSATHGMEWSIDAESIEITSGHTKHVDLALRHVVPTPGIVGCDLHVHARPSFDTPVTTEDRVLSLVSAGVDFAVPSEHNIVGDYGPATDLLRIGNRQLAHVTGVEVTTYNPRFGHFGVFPYPLGAGVPPFKGTTAGAIFTAGHRGDPNRIVQVNHPRMQMGIGYFGIVGFDPKTGRIPSSMRTDFDTIEVYNGYESANRAQVERVMEDWYALLNLGKRYAATGSSDSHRIQYQWAGYPRTFAMVDPKAAGDTGLPVDTREVVAALKKGHSFVSTGPMIEFDVVSEGKNGKPGDDLPTPRGPLTGKLRVRAAPWVDVTSVELVAGVPSPTLGALPVASGNPPGNVPGTAPGSTKVVFKSAIPSRPTRLGKEEGTLEEAAQRTIRFETELSVTVPEGTRWIIAVVRGDRPLDDALPFMVIQPLAFTNPIWLSR